MDGSLQERQFFPQLQTRILKLDLWGHIEVPSHHKAFFVNKTKRSRRFFQGQERVVYPLFSSKK